MKRAVLSALLALAGCKEATTANGQAKPNLAAPSTEAVAAAPSPVAPSPPPIADPESACPTPMDIKPAALFVRWPALVGRRTRFAAQVVRATDFAEFVITAAGHEFIVTASPDRLWSGVEAHSFTVLGSASIGVHGRTVLPLLLLLDDKECGA